MIIMYCKHFVGCNFFSGPGDQCNLDNYCPHMEETS